MTTGSENVPSEYQELLDELENDTKPLPSPKEGVLRLSIRGNVFRKTANNYEEELDTDAVKGVIVKSAPISRTYYAGEYVAGKNKKIWAIRNSDRPKLLISKNRNAWQFF